VRVTTVAQVKGLEFDVVVIPDAHDYRDDATSRRTLYVACTRALEQLWVITSGDDCARLPLRENDERQFAL
jgi:DNA helicase IV